ncbi:MAG: ParB/RepB/Spo0J family partition protein [Paludibacteraceae bacterium]|nr:ParB/RepB/Spo0J family partition protein [Paludibacteraceae bacterium]
MAKNTGNRMGRGLDSLLGADNIQAMSEQVAEIRGSLKFAEININDIHPNPNQPRKDFDDEALAELAASIKENGIISPITVRKIDEHSYQIIAGERRYRASKMAGLEKMPAYIKEVDDDKVLEMALIENIQREDLNAIEIALSYEGLVAGYGLTQEQIAERVGKKRTTVANYLRLLNLPAEIQLGLKDGLIEMGHARALVGVENTERQLEIYNQVVKEGASVRRTEDLCRSDRKPRTAKTKSKEIAELEEGLRMVLGSNVKVVYNDKGKGKIEIKFSSDEELDKLMTQFDKLKTEI